MTADSVWSHRAGPLPQLVPFLHSLNSPMEAPLRAVSLHLHADDAPAGVSEPGLSLEFQTHVCKCLLCSA